VRLSIIIIAALFLFVSSAPAEAKTYQRQYTNKQACRRMTKQIAHFEGTVLTMAQARGNALWANATHQQIVRLKNRRADICPEWGKQRTALAKLKENADKTKKMMKTAAKYAAKYFTGGLW
jgi:hypothetical protein